MRLIVKILSFVLIALSFTAHAQASFVENKGQYPKQVAYKLPSALHQVYFEKDGFTFNLIDGEDYFASSVHHGMQKTGRKKNEINAHAYKMHFVDANQNVHLEGREASFFYENYFLGNNSKQWAKEVHRFERVEYKDLYSNIDMLVYQSEGRLKYDFVLKPGADVNKVQIRYEGVNRMVLSRGVLKIITSVGEVIESKPFAYQWVDGKQKEVSCEYVLLGNTVSYKLLSSYDRSKALIIDPELIFSTYSGSVSDNWGFTACSDKLGNVYSGGINFTSGYPVTLGAYQVDFAGSTPSSTYMNCDITISKYTPDGTTLLWATYLGGADGEEMPHSLVVNEFNELIIFGTSGSEDYPVTSNAYDPTFNGGTNLTYDGIISFPNGSDIIVSKLSSDGTELTGSTFVGGSGNDGLNWRDYYAPYIRSGNDSLYYNYGDGARGEVICDVNSDVFIGSSTFSDDFPIVNGFQPNTNGMQEGVVMKLSQDLSSLEWSSYLGGSHDDAIYSVELNDSGGVYLAGGTSSYNFPTTGDAYKTSFQGGTTDGFVSYISANGSQILASSYFGSSEYDQAYFVRRDKNNNVFITGQTKAPGNELIYNASYNQPNSGQFIAKFHPNLQSLDWSTTFGTGNGKPNISITAFAVDICNRIYLSGWGREWGSNISSDATYWGNNFGTKGMEVTSDAVQPETDGQDFYVMVMYGDASGLDYASFFGEQHVGNGGCGHDHVDGGTSRFDRLGNIYQSVCASCGFVSSGGNVSCNQFPTTSGAAFEDNGGLNNSVWTCNNAVFRFSFVEDVTLADFYAPPVVCENTVVNFINTGSGVYYYWDFGDGSPISNTENPTHQYSSSGTYQVSLCVVDSNTCNISDTITKTIEVQASNSWILPPDTVCSGEFIQIGVTPEFGVDYTWSPNYGLSDINIANPYASPNSSTDYTLIIDYGACVDTVWQHIEVSIVRYEMEAKQDTFICLGDSALLQVEATTSIGNYIWATDIDFNNIISHSASSDLMVAPLQSTHYYVKTLDSICLVERLDSVFVEVSNPMVDIIGDSLVCKHQESIYQLEVGEGVLQSMHWSPEDKIISGQETNSIVVRVDTSFWLTVDFVDENDCQGQDSLWIAVDELNFSYTQKDLRCYEDCTGKIYLSKQGVPPYAFIWSDLDTTYTTVRTNLCAGNYSVTLVDGLGCMDSLDIVIHQPDEMIVQVDSLANTGCGDLWETGYVRLSVTGGVPSYEYVWTNGEAEHFIDSLREGTYFVTVTDQNGCRDTLGFEIEDSSPLEVVLSASPISCNDSCDATALVTIVVPSVPEYSYAWSTGETDTESIDSLCSGFYTVTVSDGDLCARVRSVLIQNPLELSVGVDLSHQVCYGDSVNAIAFASGGTEPYTYYWSNSETQQAVYGLTDGNYSVEVFDANGCFASSVFSIVSPPPISIEPLITGVNCEEVCNASVEVLVEGGVPPYSFTWTDDGVNTYVGTTYYADSLCSGYYSLWMEDSNGCVNLIEVNIGVNPDAFLMGANASPRTIFEGESSFLSVWEDTSYIYQWTPGNSLNNDTISHPIATPLETTIYSVNVKDKFGCVNTDTVMVRVENRFCGEPYIFIPNAFSPNGDGNNDVLYVRGEYIKELQLSIFNRWGELVFESHHPDMGWDGTFRGEPLDPAVFVYYLKVTCHSGEVFEKQGNITLIR